VVAVAGSKRPCFQAVPSRDKQARPPFLSGVG